MAKTVSRCDNIDYRYYINHDIPYAKAMHVTPVRNNRHLWYMTKTLRDIRPGKTVYKL